MSDDKEKDPYKAICNIYRSMVENKHPDKIASWPVLSGANLKVGYYNDCPIVFLEHTGNPLMHMSANLGTLPGSLIGAGQIDASNKEQVRERLYKHFRAKMDDSLLIVSAPGHIVHEEFEIMLARHEAAMGLSPMKIFLSHKSPDKTLVRNFKQTLEMLGFLPWLDEDAMAAGMELERSILKGMRESCSAVFFITPRFADENYLAAEINYAIQEYRSKPGKFSIVTLILAEGGPRPPVPALLSPFVWKEPSSHLEALREIIRSLPIKVGDVRWR